MDMKTGIETRSRKLEEVFLSGDQVQELFDLYESTIFGIGLCHANDLGQILPLLSTVPTFSRLRQASKWILRSKSPPILDDSRYWSEALRTRSNNLSLTCQTTKQSFMGHYGGSPADRLCRESAVLALRLAFANQFYLVGSYAYACRPNDANCKTDRATQAISRTRLYKAEY